MVSIRMKRSGRFGVGRAAIVLGLAAALTAMSPREAMAQSEEMAPKVVPPLPAGIESPTNAALLYGRALRLIGPDALKTMQVDAKANPGWMTGEVAAGIEQHAGSLKLVVEAAQLATCDWGVEYEKGPLALLDHLSPMRQLTRVLDARAQIALANGDSSAAARDVATILNIAEHVTQDRVLLSSLVSMAVCKLAVTRAEQMLNDGVMTREDARIVLEGVERLQATQGFGTTDALRMERWMIVEWMRAACEGPNPGSLLVDWMGWLSGDVDDEAAKGLAALDERGVAGQFDGIARAYDDLIAAWSAEDSEAAIQRVQDAVSSGAYGLLAQMYIPDFSKSHSAAMTVSGSLDALAERLEQVK